MSEDFGGISADEYAEQMHSALVSLVDLRSQLDAALSEGDNAKIQAASEAIHAMVCSISWGAIPSALLSLAGRIIEERSNVLILLDALHDAVRDIRASVRDLEVAGIEAGLLIPLVDIGVNMAEAINGVPYERVSDE